MGCATSYLLSRTALVYIVGSPPKGVKPSKTFIPATLLKYRALTTS